MRLVPKQLRRAGMTGNVPYYGGRFSPAQAYAAAHPSVPGFPVPGLTAATSGRPPVPPASRPESQADPLTALQHLLDTGVITTREYAEMRARLVA
ncbi:MAG TPA: SHOCT domain-containing protein [Jiangellaceae bacterium]